MRKNFRFSEKHRRECPFCGRELKSPQALSGHVQMRHPDLFVEWRSGATDEEFTGGEEPSPTPVVNSHNLRDRENEVKLLKLERERRNLIRELGEGGQKSYPDLAEVSGFGKLQPEIAREIQSRAFQAQQSSHSEQPWWQSLLSNVSLNDLISTLRGVLGQNSSGGLEAVGTLLKLIGERDLKSLIGSGGSIATAPRDFELPGGVVIPSGFPLDPGLLRTLIESKGGNPLANALKESVGQIVMLLESERSPGRRDVDGIPEDFLTCTCGNEVPVPTGLKPGDVVECSVCHECFEIKDKVSGKPDRATKRRFLEVETPEVESVQCPTCNQSLDVTGRPLGSRVKCPVCGGIVNIVSETVSIPAVDVRDYE